MTESELKEFWKQVYVAAIQSGQNALAARTIADESVANLKKSANNDTFKAVRLDRRY